MNYFELRQSIESFFPWWAGFVIPSILLVVIGASWVITKIASRYDKRPIVASGINSIEKVVETHQVRISRFGKKDHHGFYCIEVKFPGKGWRTVDHFLYFVREMNPILLRYDDAKKQAARFKDLNYLLAHEQEEKRRYNEANKKHWESVAKQYPVERETI